MRSRIAVATLAPFLSAAALSALAQPGCPTGYVSRTALPLP